jgi:hypothetical protein
VSSDQLLMRRLASVPLAFRCVRLYERTASNGIVSCMMGFSDRAVFTFYL